MNPLDSFSTSVSIHTEPAAVWNALTDPALMKKWMGEPELKIEIETDWKVGGPIVIRGFHHVKFENKGTVLAFYKNERLSYSHLSSVSRLPDVPASYSRLEFILAPSGKDTILTLTIVNFPTDTIRRHLEFYWKATIAVIKERVEGRQATPQGFPQIFAD